MSQHKSGYVISYHGILGHDMLYVMTMTYDHRGTPNVYIDIKQQYTCSPSRGAGLSNKCKQMKSSCNRTTSTAYEMYTNMLEVSQLALLVM